PPRLDLLPQGRHLGADHLIRIFALEPRELDVELSLGRRIRSPIFLELGNRRARPTPRPPDGLRRPLRCRSSTGLATRNALPVGGSLARLIARIAGRRLAPRAGASSRPALEHLGERRAPVGRTRRARVARL